LKVVVRPAAAADIEDAFRWYRDKGPVLGDAFLRALRDSMLQVVEHPEAFPVVHRDTRRIRVRRFPYGLFYRVYSDTIVVVACMHGRRDPRRWRSRA
jgi:plasmid stabilization system protein ParE